jgi:hypothetical protein
MPASAAGEISQQERLDLTESIRAAAEVLQRELAHIDRDLADMDTDGQSSQTGFMELLVLRFEKIAIRIDGSRNHACPHIHVDYRRERHTASYSIDNGKRLAGDLETYYDNKVRKFITKTKIELRSLWDMLRTEQIADDVICELQSSFDY